MRPIRQRSAYALAGLATLGLIYSAILTLAFFTDVWGLAGLVVAALVLPFAVLAHAGLTAVAGAPAPALHLLTMAILLGLASWAAPE